MSDSLCNSQSTSLVLAPSVAHVQLTVFWSFSLFLYHCHLSSATESIDNFSEAPRVHSEELLDNMTEGLWQWVYETSFEYYIFPSNPPKVVIRVL